MRLLAALIIISFSTQVFAQNREKAFEINQKLGRGINYGNMFEAPSETAWGNQWQPEYAAMIAELGFKHVRIPIRWEPDERSAATSPYSINPTFLNRIQQVVDSALNNGLYAIINMHHHEALFENPDGQKERFMAQWKQISEYYTAYPDQLIFELLNEPHGNLSADKWNNFLAEAITTIRQDNPDRIILIGTAEYGGLGGLSKLQIPDDENIILTAHYYNPFHFTHQGAEWADGSDVWLGTEWTDTETERKVVQNDFAPLKAYELEHNIPIHIGEFGAYSKADIVSREKWTTYIARYLETLNWSWAYWEFSAGFGIYDKDVQDYNPELVDALLHNPMPEPAKYVGTAVYSSNFSESIGDWNVYTNSASAVVQQVDNNLKVVITSGGTEGWHIQLVKNNVQLQAGKKYRITFKAKADINLTTTSYVGQSNSPWASYSGYNGISISDTFAVYTYVFDAASTDNSARIVFDLGKSSTNLTFEYITLEEIVLETPTMVNVINHIKSKIYPNPFTSTIVIDNQDNFQQFLLINLRGQILLNKTLNPFQNRINLEHFSSGIYFVKLIGENNRFETKIIKK